MQKFLNLLIIIVLLAISWLLNQYYPNIDLAKITASFTALTILYFAFHVLLINLIVHRLRTRKTQFLFVRLVNAVFYLFLSFWILTIWIENTETLLLSYGLVSAALALALQDLFKNIVGGISLLFSGIYHVGDRVDIDGNIGDIIAIDLFNTTMFEIKNWVGGDQPTGRIITIPNQKTLTANISNYTKDHNFIWDEIMIPITYDSNWLLAKQTIEDIIHLATKTTVRQAEQQMDKLAKKYFFEETPAKSDIFISITDNWIELRARYVTNTKERRTTFNDISVKILSALQKKRSIKIASQTIQFKK